MTEPTYSQADSDSLPDPSQGQPERSGLLDEELTNLAAQVNPFFTRPLEQYYGIIFEQKAILFRQTWNCQRRMTGIW
jgi:hypothetical protein